MLRTLLINIAILFVGCGVIVFAFEVGARLLLGEEAAAKRTFGLAMYEVPDDVERQVEPRITYEKKPHFIGAQKTDELAYTYETNRFGWHDREYGEDELAGGINIVMLGDSFTSGHHCGGRDCTFSKVMERKLRALTGKACINVLNTGTNGYGTVDALAYYKNRIVAAGLRHAFVVHAAYLGNDLIDNREVFRKTVFNGHMIFLNEVDKISLADRLGVWLRQHSDFFVLYLNPYYLGVTRQLGLRSEKRTTAEAYYDAIRRRLVVLYGGVSDPAFEADLAVFRRMLAEMADAASGAGADFTFFLIPQQATFARTEAEREAMQAKYNVTLGERDVASLPWPRDNDIYDVGPTLERLGQPTLSEIYLRADSHLNARGQELLGGILADKFHAHYGERLRAMTCG